MNRTRLSALSNLTPFKTLFKSKPNLSVIQEFGKPCWAFKDKTNEKLENPGVEGWCIGIKQRSEAYYALLCSGKIILTRNVHFGSHHADMCQFPKPPRFSVLNISLIPNEEMESDVSNENVSDSGIISNEGFSSSDHDSESFSLGSSSLNDQDPSEDETIESGPAEAFVDPHEQGETSVTETLDLELVELVALPDTHTPNDPVVPELPTRQSTRSTRYQGNYAFVASTVPSDSVTPSVEEAIKCKDWSEYEKAIKEEIKSLEANETWELVDRPLGANIIKSKLILKRKRIVAD